MGSSVPLFVLPQGHLLLHELIDYRMLHNGDMPMFTFAFPGKEDLIEISFSEFGKAVHRVAHLVRPDPFAGHDNEIIAIVANIDSLAYYVLAMSIIRAGLTVFPISHRNSAAAIIHMLQTVGCHRILTTPKCHNNITDTLMTSVQAECPKGFVVNIEYIPSPGAVYPHISGISDESPWKAYPHKERSLNDVCLYLHSSGSTGFPKPIPWTFRVTRMTANSEYNLDRLTVDPPIRKLGVYGLPPFHGFGCYTELIGSLALSLGVHILPPTSAHLKSTDIPTSPSWAIPILPTSDVIIENIVKTHAEALIIVPTFLEDWAMEADEEKLSVLKELRVIVFSGGPLAFDKGEFLVSRGIKIRSIYAGTEFGFATGLWGLEVQECKDWNYFRFSERAHPLFIPQEESDLLEEEARTFEIRLLSCETHDFIVKNFTTEVEIHGKKQLRSGYATSDLVQRHPTKKNLWKIVGRQDDVLILSSGEKTVPAPIEEAIVQDKRIRSAVLFGRGHDQVGVLVEPAEYVQDTSAFMNDIWPTVQAATANSPDFSRIFKHMILVARQDKPFLRADKGTLKKKATIALYSGDIDALYAATGKDTPVVEPPKSWSAQDVELWLLNHAEKLISSSAAKARLDVGRSIFEQGFNSISSVSSKPLAKTLPLNVVFSHAAISDLARYLSDVTSSGDANVSNESIISERVKVIEETIARLSTGFSSQRRNGPLMVSAVVLLTGTTGGLGSFLLASLLCNDKVKKVYAYNRPGKKSVEERQVDAFIDRDLPVDLLHSDKVVFVEGDAAAERLGLQHLLYEEIRSSVTAIIHNAWRLDFNLALPSFEPHLFGTKHLIELASSSPNADSIRFIFTSSIGITQSWPRNKGPYPEEIQHEAKYAVGGGYGEAKYICERVIEKSGLQATSFRIGQISGPVPNGFWATSDWVTMLIKSSVSMGAFPDLTGTAAWLPVTAVSTAITDVLFRSDQPPLALNIVHPRPLKWTAIMSAVRQAIQDNVEAVNGVELPLVPFSSWFAQLHQASHFITEETLRNMPVIKIIDFLRNFLSDDRENVETTGPVLLMEKMQTISETIGTLPPLGSEDAKAWVRYWNSKGLFD